jgi:hypothetical protein
MTAAFFVANSAASNWNGIASAFSLVSTFPPGRAFFAQPRATFARLGLCVQQKTWSFAGKTVFNSVGTKIASEYGRYAFRGGIPPRNCSKPKQN